MVHIPVKKLIILIVILFASFNIESYAQIICPDTVCVNTPVLFKTPYSAITYAWIFDTVNVNQNSTTYSTAFSGSPLAVPTFTIMCNDGGNYYAFTTNYVSNEVIRLDFGTNPNNIPTATNLGTFSMSSSITEGIDIVKDSAANNWYGLVVGGSDLLFLNFGTSLTNTPSSSLTNYSSNLVWPHQLTIKKYGTAWIAFVANRNGGMTRFDFGSSLTNTPTVTNLPSVGGIQNPCNFCIYQEGGNWYMLVTNLITGTITRLDFGTNLMNNSPTGVNLGNPNNLLSIPRSVNIVPGCNQLLAYLFNEDGQLTKLDFQGSILDTPVITNMGNNVNSTTNGTYPYLYSGEYYLLLSEVSTNSVMRYSFINLPSPNICSYYVDSALHTFTQSGIYNITLFCDQSNFLGPVAFCKQIVVVTNGSGKTVDTALCNQPFIILNDSSGTGAYAWNNGDTTASIVATTSGTYWVKTGNLCNATDTFHVALGDVPDVKLGGNISVCGQQAISLESSGSFNNPVYLWSTGANSASITVNQTGNYWLTVTQDGCKATDTVSVQFKPIPKVMLGNDTGICNFSSLTLSSSQPAGSVYLWSNGSSGDSISAAAGTYWLKVTDNGCSAADSITIFTIQKPAINMTDSAACFEDVIILPQYADSNCYHCSFLWSDGSSESTLQVTQAGVYYVTVSNICGTIADTASIEYVPCNIWFPNAFTPNGDGKNDIARIVGNLGVITNVTLAIYNRWGQRVFYTNDQYQGWDGVFNGTPQPIGTFDYMIIYYFRGEKHLLKGTLELIR